MAQMVHILETSPKFSFLKTLQLFFCFIFSNFAERLFTYCVIILVMFKPILCIFPRDNRPESAFFPLGEPETSILFTPYILIFTHLNKSSHGLPLL